MNSASPSVPLDPSRARRLPRTGFGWIDRRFFRDGYSAELIPDAMLLYAFLCSVADRRGHSWYGEPRLGHMLRLSPARLTAARAQLVAADLVRYEAPTYQVLSLPDEPVAPPAPAPTPAAATADQPSRLGDLLRRHL